MSDTPEAKPVLPPVVQVSRLSIQAASLIRSIDALSTIFWISIGSTILTVKFAGLGADGVRRSCARRRIGKQYLAQEELLTHNAIESGSGKDRSNRRDSIERAATDSSGRCVAPEIIDDVERFVEPTHVAAVLNA